MAPGKYQRRVDASERGAREAGPMMNRSVKSMTGHPNHWDHIEPAMTWEPQQPNSPEVSGTSFPLLSTVLAGFSVTIAAQLILRPDASDDMPLRVMIALVALLTSALLFLSSIGFALNAQANNYLPFLELGETGRRLLDVKDHTRWIIRIERRWKVFHTAAFATFAGGVALLLSALNLMVWVHVGSGMALVLLAVITTNIALSAGVTAWVYRREPDVPDTTAPTRYETGE
jgi:hypothetical protein